MQIHECIDGRCPVGVDSVKEIVLSKKEKRAIFVYLKREIGKLKAALQDIPKPSIQ